MTRARSKILTPLWTRKKVRDFYSKVGNRAEHIIYELLRRAGEEFIRYAREYGNYTDWTGNLRSSIGYAIVKNGSILEMNVERSTKNGTDKTTGVREGVELLRFLAAVEYRTGVVLIGVAGMKYAAAVEALENKDVIGMAASRVDDFVMSLSRQLFNGLKIAA
jgi:hypothetical protein